MPPSATGSGPPFPVSVVLPVQWGDQDAFGHVNNIVYFRWFESARIAYFDRLGLRDRKETGDKGPILAAIQCDFLRAVKYPDTVQVGARISRIGNSSMTMEHEAYSQAQSAVVARGTSTIVAYDYAAARPFPVPGELRAAISALEGGPR